jgi:hypothetical protein
MKTFLSQSTLAHRLNLHNETLVARIRIEKIDCDAVVINGNRSLPLFDADRLPDLRRVLTQQPIERTVT